MLCLHGMEWNGMETKSQQDIIAEETEEGKEKGGEREG